MIRWPAYHAGYGAWVVMETAVRGGVHAKRDAGGEPLVFPTHAAALAWIEEHRG